MNNIKSVFFTYQTHDALVLFINNYSLLWSIPIWFLNYFRTNASLMVSTKILSSQMVLFASWVPNHYFRKILKDHVTLKSGVMAAENLAFSYRNKLHFKIYSVIIIIKLLFIFISTLYIHIIYMKSSSAKRTTDQYIYIFCFALEL